jgi:hypothetical protein
MNTQTMGMKLTLAYCRQAVGYKFEPASRQRQSAKQLGDKAPALPSTMDPLSKFLAASRWSMLVANLSLASMGGGREPMLT